MGDDQIVLKGDSSLTKTKVTFKNTTKTWKSDQGFLVKFKALVPVSILNRVTQSH